MGNRGNTTARALDTRIYLWDNIKFLLILLVVMGHLADCYTDVSTTCRRIYLFIYSFHMPLFLFISGLFHKDRDILSKCINYASIGFFTKIINAGARNIFRDVDMKFSLLSDSGIPWFMFVLAGCCALTYLLRKQNKWFILIAFFMIALFVGYDKDIGDDLYLSRFVIFYPFYLLGNLLQSHRILKWRAANKWLVLPAIAILVTWMMICWIKIEDVYILRSLFTGRNSFEEEVVGGGPLFRLLTYGITVFVCFAIVILLPNRKIPFVSYAGTKTLQVFVWHWAMFELLDYFLQIRDWFYAGTFGQVAFLLFAIILTVLLSVIPIFSYPMRWIKTAVFYRKRAQT